MFGDDDFGRLDDDDDGVAGGEVEVGGGVFGDRRGDRLAVAEYGVDGGHDLAVMDVGDDAAELVACAELEVGAARRRLTDGVQGLVEEAADGAGAFAAPQVDEVVVWVGRGEHVDGRGEDLLLGGE